MGLIPTNKPLIPDGLSSLNNGGVPGGMESKLCHTSVPSLGLNALGLFLVVINESGKNQYPYKSL